MPSIADLLNPRCPECRRHEIWDQGLCWYCLADRGLLPEPSEEYEAMRDRLGAIAGNRKPYYRSEGAEYYDTDGVMDDE